MYKRLLSDLIIVLVALLMVSCAQTGITDIFAAPVRGISNNIFHSTKMPKIAIHVNENLPYSGEFKTTMSQSSPDWATNVTYTGYLFGKTSNQVISEGVVITHAQIAEGYWLNNCSWRGGLVEKYTRLNGIKYCHTVSTGNYYLFGRAGQTLAAERGLKFSGTYLVDKIETIVKRDIMFIVFYFERISTDNDETFRWKKLNVNSLSDEDQSTFDQFIESANKAYTMRDFIDVAPHILPNRKFVQ